MYFEFKVDPDILSQMAENIQQELTEIERQFEDIRSKIYRTGCFWEGNASDHHKEMYESLTSDIQEAIRRLKSDPKNLLTIAGIYKATEQQQIQTAQTLQEDVII